MTVPTPTPIVAWNDTTWEVPDGVCTVFRPKRTRSCICIPVINEGERIQRQLKTIQQMGGDRIADIIICDGGSTDGSTEHALLRSLGVRTLLVKTGTGKLSAQLRMGYAYALREGYLGIITVDGNGKDGMDALPRFLDALDAGVDYVQGSRFMAGGQAIRTPLLRWFGIRCIHAPLLSLAAHRWLTDTTNGFRAYSRRYLMDARVQPFRNIFQTYELLAYLSVRASQLGMAYQEIPVRRAYPRGSVPTKIHRGAYGALLRILWNTLTGVYNPSSVRRSPKESHR